MVKEEWILQYSLFQQSLYPLLAELCLTPGVQVICRMIKIANIFFSLAKYRQCARPLYKWGIKSLRAIEWQGAEAIIPF